MDNGNEMPSFPDDDTDYLPRPWEQPGATRRDCDSHRGPILLTLGRLSIVCGFLVWCLLLPVIPGVILGTVGYTMARADLDRMRAGLIDPNGRKEVQEAERLSAIGLWLNLLPCFFLGVIWLIVVLA